MRVRIVANGEAYILDLWNPLSGDLGARVSQYLSNIGYQVLDVSVIRSAAFSALIGTRYAYQITLSLDTKHWPSDVQSVTNAVRGALLTAAGQLPSAIAVTSAGQPAPAAPEPGMIDAVTGAVGTVAGALQTAARGIDWLVVALVLGLTVVIIIVAQSPAPTLRAITR